MRAVLTEPASLIVVVLLIQMWKVKFHMFDARRSGGQIQQNPVKRHRNAADARKHQCSDPASVGAVGGFTSQLNKIRYSPRTGRLMKGIHLKSGISETEVGNPQSRAGGGSRPGQVAV